MISGDLREIFEVASRRITDCTMLRFYLCEKSHSVHETSIFKGLDLSFEVNGFARRFLAVIFISETFRSRKGEGS